MSSGPWAPANPPTTAEILFSMAKNFENEDLWLIIFLLFLIGTTVLFNWRIKEKIVFSNYK
jgi:hypothetical protein